MTERKNGLPVVLEFVFPSVLGGGANGSIKCVEIQLDGGAHTHPAEANGHIIFEAVVRSQSSATSSLFPHIQ